MAPEVQTFVVVVLSWIWLILWLSLLHEWRLHHTQHLEELGSVLDITRPFGWAVYENARTGQWARVFFCHLPLVRTWGPVVPIYYFDSWGADPPMGWRKHVLIHLMRSSGGSCWRLDPPLP